jgi:uncharacterized protein (TIGR03067 family)
LLLVCLGLFAAAFAPAPFPRPRRTGPDTTVERIQGTWTILKLSTTDGKGGLRDSGNYLKEVRIDRGQWRFVYTNPASAPVVYSIRVDASKSPAPLDLTRPGEATPYGTGIVVREGQRMRVLYSFGRERPTNFAMPPAGYWHLTLQFAR